MAYAHSRGVMHRDLKPANVMVGAFGEVQVVDWGFAKVLAQGGVADELRARKPVDESVIHTVRTDSAGSQSQAGSVLGTPAYMPPEQAFGRIEEIDERADVFALGGILCEILTGLPPYVPESGDLLMQAAQADLDQAHTRLDACGADDELVRLARSCLHGGLTKRPRNASVVAAAVTGYLASVEERARQAELAAAEEKVKVEEERKRRRLTVGLAAAILVTVATAGGVYGWYEKKRLDRRQANTMAITDAVREAAEFEAAAEHSVAESIDLSRRLAQLEASLAKWEQADLVAVRAADLAQKLDERDDSVALKATDRLESIRRGYAAAKKERDRVAKDVEVVRTLDGVRVRIGEAFNFLRVNRDYKAVFGDYPIDLADPETAAAQIRNSAVATGSFSAVKMASSLIFRRGPRSLAAAWRRTYMAGSFSPRRSRRDTSVQVGRRGGKARHERYPGVITALVRPFVSLDRMLSLGAALAPRLTPQEGCSHAAFDHGRVVHRCARRASHRVRQADRHKSGEERRVHQSSAQKARG